MVQFLSVVRKGCPQRQQVRYVPIADIEHISNGCNLRLKIGPVGRGAMSQNLSLEFGLVLIACIAAFAARR